MTTLTAEPPSARPLGAVGANVRNALSAARKAATDRLLCLDSRSSVAASFFLSARVLRLLSSSASSCAVLSLSCENFNAACSLFTLSRSLLKRSSLSSAASLRLRSRRDSSRNSAASFVSARSFTVVDAVATDDDDPFRPLRIRHPSRSYASFTSFARTYALGGGLELGVGGSLSSLDALRQSSSSSSYPPKCAPNLTRRVGGADTTLPVVGGVVVVALPPSRIARRGGVRIATFVFIFSTVLLVVAIVPRRRSFTSSASTPEDSGRPSAHIHDSRASVVGGIVSRVPFARAALHSDVSLELASIRA